MHLELARLHGAFGLQLLPLKSGLGEGLLRFFLRNKWNDEAAVTQLGRPLPCVYSVRPQEVAMSMRGCPELACLLRCSCFSLSILSFMRCSRCAALRMLCA